MRNLFFILIAALILSTNPANSKQRIAINQHVFKLVKEYDNSKIPNLKSSSIPQNENDYVHALFTPIKGEGKVYIFRATYMGESYPNGDEKEFHDLMVIEVNTTDIITNAYSYTEEWGEGPLTTDLFKATQKNLKIAYLKDASQLNFVGSMDADIWGPKGIIEWNGK